jgi:hypothetical protein
MSDKVISDFDMLLTPEEREILDSLDTPFRIQAFLDETPYSAEDANRSPVRVLRERTAHCLDGALFAAAMLRRIGHPPLILDLLPEPRQDDDHVLAIFRSDAHFGAVAKSNFTGLRFREPIYRNLRELVLSYFEAFFNVYGQKTLRAYSRLMDLRHYDRFDWLTTDHGVDIIEKRLYSRKRIPLVDRRMVAQFSLVDEITYRAGMLVVNQAGLYKPERASEL